MLTTEEMENIKFKKSNIGGYKAEEVDSFIKKVNESYKRLQGENSELLTKVKILAQKVSEYKDSEGSVQIALVKAQKVADDTIKEAKIMSEVIISNAKKEADKILDDIKKEVDEQKDMLVGMKKKVKEFRANILSLYKEHIKLVNSFTADDRMTEEMLEKAEKTEPELPQKTEKQLEKNQEEKKDTPKPRKSKFTDLKFGEDYDVSADESMSPVGLFK